MAIDISHRLPDEASESKASARNAVHVNIDFSMQSAAIRLQSRQRAPSVLAVCERLFNCTVSTSAGTSSGRVGQSLFDQQPVSGFIEKAFKYCPAPHQTSAKDCFAIPRKAFTSSAEFSGGRFKVSSPASKQDDRHNGASEDDIDDRVILLEASLKFVVITCEVFCTVAIVIKNIPQVSSIKLSLTGGMHIE